jgi:hypothetical protein
MPVIWRGIGNVGIQKGFHHADIQNCVVMVLDVAAKFVLIPGEELGVADRGEAEDLGDDA